VSWESQSGQMSVIDINISLAAGMATESHARTGCRHSRTLYLRRLSTGNDRKVEKAPVA
jgi:hypothetical protein